MTVLVKSDFAFENTTAVPNAAIVGPGAWGVTSQKVYGPSSQSLLVWNAGTGNVKLSATVTLSPIEPASPDFAFRVIDFNNFLMVGVSLRTGVNRIVIAKRDVGTFTTLATFTATLTYGSVHPIRVEANGSVITVFQDNVQVLTHTLSAPDQTKFGTATLHGFRSQGPAGDSGQSRWDDLRIENFGGGEPPVVASDAFTRPGPALGASPSGHAWRILDGSGDPAPWIISNNQLTGPARHSLAVLEVGRQDVWVGATVTLGPEPASPDLVMRVVDFDNFLMLGIVKRTGHDRVTLAKRQAGAYTTLAQQTPMGLVAGNTYTAQVRLDGDLVEVYWQGSLLFSHTLSSADLAALNGTQHGLRAQATSVDASSKWDNFIINSAVLLPPAVPPSGVSVSALGVVTFTPGSPPSPHTIVGYRAVAKPVP